MTIQETALRYKETKDEQLFTVLYNYVSYINKCIAYKYDMQASDDVLQDTMVNVLTKMHQYNESEGYFTTWINTIIKNKYLKRFSYESKFSDAEFAIDNESYIEEYADEEEDYITPQDVMESTLEYIQNLKLTAATSLAPEQVKYILIQGLVRNRKYADVSKEVETISEEGIKSIIYRHKKKIKEFILIKYKNKLVPL